MPLNIVVQKQNVFLSVFDVDKNRIPTEFNKSSSSGGKVNEKWLDLNSFQSQWHNSWLLVTKTLELPKNFEKYGSLEPKKKLIDSKFKNALQILLRSKIESISSDENVDIVAWLSSQVRQHYVNQVLPCILQAKNLDTLEYDLFHSIGILESTRRLYEYKLLLIKQQMDIVSPGISITVISKFQRDLDAIISNTIIDSISIPLARTLNRYVAIALKLTLPNDFSNNSIHVENLDEEKAEEALIKLVNRLKYIGLAGEGFQIIFAEVLNNALSYFINGICHETLSLKLTTAAKESSSERKSIENFQLNHQRVSLNPSRCVKDIFEWIESRYAKLAFRVLGLLNNKINISWPEKLKFKDIGISRLANFRCKQLFSIVTNWPHNGEALDDLRTAINTPERRLHLTELFAKTLAKEVLHPAASTTRILKTYISMIWSFHSLDQSKVLLDKVSYPLQLYLYTREDTVRIILSGLLADTENSHSGNMGNKLLELAWLLNNESESISQKANDIGLDWHDMDWIPDPVDAGPTYKRSKNADIIGTLVSFLGSREVFIKEFQNILGDSFLKFDEMFSREIKVLELLKLHFGEASLQACEVMLKDIEISREVDSKIQEIIQSKIGISVGIQDNQSFSKVDTDISKTFLHAKILSRLFWPQLPNESFQIPPEIVELQTKYAKEFTLLKPSRKLKWLDTSGMATIEIELEDRTLIENVHTWQAAVIWAFQNEGIDDQPQKRTITELLNYLRMEEGLIRSALRFWVNKYVLFETSLETYVVRETLSPQDQANLNSGSRPLSKHDEKIFDNKLDAINSVMNEKMEIYWQFIQGMLTNSSRQMPLQQIAMMLKTLIIDGFPHTNDELKEFLKQKITDGLLELSSGKYRLKK
ncbi:putative anaphase-promoting complex subunit [Erysiphe necator]|uniref:Anaphase-promoting complex subunit 2 n=1 Tax=Uncinula necator TaxID=52586 RepID=A0A0B1PCH2_UNCNE|nr:putative anaphase-promoting complex subunit [Erysiphe necator]